MKKIKKIRMILLGTVLLTILAVVMEFVGKTEILTITRNGYGNGNRKETFTLNVEGEVENQSVEVEIEERKYTREETKKIFEELLDKMDNIVLGDNASFDHVEEKLHLITSVEGYPMKIRWELSSYDVLNLDGEVQETYVDPKGSMVELRGIITYEEEEAVYVRSAILYPKTYVGEEKFLKEVQQKIADVQESTREQASFTLPQEVSGKKLEWSKGDGSSWYYIPVLGMALSIWVVYRERNQVKKAAQKKEEELLREYPGIVSKLTMLLEAGITMKSAWEKIVQSYERQKQQTGVRLAYEEMGQSLRQMKSGVTEAEAYEDFGKRCGTFVYIKFGALLSQNLRKGSQGLVEFLRMEGIQAFENRKNTAKRMGEEAGTRLLMPMFGMLAVVFIMVMVPAFLSMQF